MPRARNKIETARHVYFSLEMYRSVRRMMSAVRQQLTIVRKYRITVSQPPIVGSPIPGLQLNSCIRDSQLLALRNESWPDLSILISFEVRAWRSTMTTAFSIVVVFVLSGVANVRPIRRGVPRQRERRARHGLHSRLRTRRSGEPCRRRPRKCFLRLY